MDEAPQALARVTSGVRGLDTVLQGGWIRGGTYLVAGGPGTGKTILGNQMCFTQVAAGGRALYVTVQTESHERMLQNMASLRFFHREVVGQQLRYVSGYSIYRAEGLEGLGRLLYRLVREQEAQVLVVDGLVVSEEEESTTRMALYELLNGMALHTALSGCTTVLLTSQSRLAGHPQCAMLDGTLLLQQQLRGLRTVRDLQVLKFSGTPSLLGEHVFTLGEEGLVVYPRTESLHTSVASVASMAPEAKVRLGFGVPKLDEMLGGGLPRYSSTLVFGVPGSGKTLLGLYYLALGASLGESCLFWGHTERPGQLLAKAARVGLELEPHLRQGRLRMVVQSELEALPDAVVGALLDAVERHHVQRLVLDGLEPFLHEPLDRGRLPDLLSALLGALRHRGVTVVMTQQTHALIGLTLQPPVEGLEAVSDNILFLRHVELRSQLYRMLSVLKMRDSDHDTALRQFLITPKGLQVSDTFGSAEAILSGQARTVPVPLKSKARPQGRPRPSRGRGKRT